VTSRRVVLTLCALVLCSCGGALSTTGLDAGAAAGEGGVPAETLLSGLAAAWSFDGDGKDHSGQGLDLGVDKIPFVAGRYGKGVQFSGDGSPIAQRPINDPSLDLTTGDFTVSFWISFTKTGSPQFVTIKGYADGGWFVGWAQSVWAFGFPAPAAGGQFADPSDAPALGVFHQVVFERTAAQLQLIVDGRLLGGQTIDKDPPAPGPAPFQVGGYSPGGVGGSKSVVNGVVDDVAIWHRALDADERLYLRTHAVP
jgi:Concanavalin A-like lectin/glucanases superfamily